MASVTEFSLTNSSNPDGGFVGPDGLYWVPCHGIVNRVSKVALDGSISNYTVGSSNYWMAGCAGPDGNVWLSGDTSSVGKCDTSGGNASTPNTSLTPDPRYIATGSDGNLWVACYNIAGTGAINRITTGGARTSYSVTSSRHPFNICSDGTNLWFTESNLKYFGKITTGGAMTEYGPTSVNFYGGLCLGNDGNLWAGGAGKLFKITLAGAVTEINSGGGNVNAVCVGPDGLLWYAERSRGGTTDYIVQANYSGTILQSIATLTNGNGNVGGAASAGGYVWYHTFSGATCKVGRISPDYPPPRTANARQAVTRSATR